MQTRYTYLAKDLSLANSGEKTVDIPIRDPITSLFLEMRATNGSNNNSDTPMHLCVDAVELIDGSTVLWSLDGPEMLGMVCAQLGFMPNQKVAEIPNDPQSLSLPILFGNFIGDTERSFDPTRFVNPQFRVKWNIENVNSVGVTGYVDASLTMTLIAEVMEGAPAPRSMLMAKEIYTYTAADGTEYVDLPRDYPYKGLMVRAVATTSHWWEVISNLKLDLDGGKNVPFDIATEDLQYLLFQKQPPLHCRQMFHKANGATIYPILKELEGLALVGESTEDVVAIYNNYEYGQRTISVYQAGSPWASLMNLAANIRGYFPYHCVYIPFGDPLKPETWFPAPQYGSVRLELEGEAARSIYLCVLQDRVY